MDQLDLKNAVLVGHSTGDGPRDKITTSRMERLMNVLVACHRKLRTIFVTNAWAIWS